jgi:hypothetical protein
MDSWGHWQWQCSGSVMPFLFSAMHAGPEEEKNKNNTHLYFSHFSDRDRSYEM